MSTRRIKLLRLNGDDMTAIIRAIRAAGLSRSIADRLVNRLAATVVEAERMRCEADSFARAVKDGPQFEDHPMPRFRL